MLIFDIFEPWLLYYGHSNDQCNLHTLVVVVLENRSLQTSFLRGLLAAYGLMIVLH